MYIFIQMFDISIFKFIVELYENAAFVVDLLTSDLPSKSSEFKWRRCLVAVVVHSTCSTNVHNSLPSSTWHIFKLILLHFSVCIACLSSTLSSPTNKQFIRLNNNSIPVVWKWQHNCDHYLCCQHWGSQPLQHCSQMMSSTESSATTASIVDNITIHSIPATPTVRPHSTSSNEHKPLILGTINNTSSPCN